MQVTLQLPGPVLGYWKLVNNAWAPASDPRQRSQPVDAHVDRRRCRRRRRRPQRCDRRSRRAQYHADPPTARALRVSPSPLRLNPAPLVGLSLTGKVAIFVPGVNRDIRSVDFSIDGRPTTHVMRTNRPTSVARRCSERPHVLDPIACRRRAHDQRADHARQRHDRDTERAVPDVEPTAHIPRPHGEHRRGRSGAQLLDGADVSGSGSQCSCPVNPACSGPSIPRRRQAGSAACALCTTWAPTPPVPAKLARFPTG